MPHVGQASVYLVRAGTGPSGICVPSVVGCFGVHEDDFQDVTGESDGELVEANFWGVTG